MTEEEIYELIHQEMSNHYFDMHKYGRESELRDQFAAHVLTGLARGYRSVTGCDGANIKKVMALDCKIAYALADAMLEARKQTE